MYCIKISGDNAGLESWDYNPNGKTEDEKWPKGDKVKCQVFPFLEQDKTIAIAKIEAGAFHGRTVAKSDYYYTVLLGRGEFFFYDGEELLHRIPVQEGDVLLVPEGADYDYQAQSQDLQVHLVMNNFWNIGDEYRWKLDGEFCWSR